MKDILLDFMPDVVLNVKEPILDQLIQIVDKLNALDIDTQSNLMEREIKKFEKRFFERISSEIYI